ncbi:GGDEF domain-containing protein [Maricurvus nonylphenolicus]|uniref:GGDEF domain-containing protein n=1 Tax=Maricurvus nonylphenolicus TaxID=1008307 RepID=UPI0036F25B9F
MASHGNSSQDRSLQENPWREKYLQALDEQERIQASADEQAEILRKALVRVSLAADGLDAELDEVLGRLRDKLRDKKVAGREEEAAADLADTLASLESRILDFEKRRDHREESLETAVSKLNQNLQGISTSRETKKQLKKHASAIAVSAKDPGSLPKLLAELADIQAELLSAAEDSESKAASKGLFGRLFDRGDTVTTPASDTGTAEEGEELSEHRSEAAQDDESSANDVEPEVVEAEPVEAVLEGQLETHDEIVEQQAKEDRQPEAVFQKPVHEPAFSRISDKILRVLNDLLDNIEPTECVVSRVASARSRIEAGLNWYELVPTLEDIRDLIMQAYLAAGKAFGDYLLQVDQALNEISKALGVVLEEHQADQEKQRVFDREVTEQLDSMGHSVAEAGDLEQLKHQVSSHIDSIRLALHERQDKKPSSESDAANLSEQLAKLAAQVQAIEEEAKTAKQDLDEQRQKALRDPLTELPNREAYSERVHEEFKRWQRYQRPLTLAVCDIDHFKRINDTYGHQAGDRVLKVLSRGIAKRLREVDFMARYGGEEFVLVLPETQAQQAHSALDKIREAIAQTPFHFKEAPVQITLSMGIAEFSEGDTVEKVFARADKQLYVAKEQGRNRCLVAE